MTDITLVSRGYELRAYLRVPDGPGPWPGVLVMHDGLGQSAPNRRLVDWLAASGYLATAPDLYSWSNKFRCWRTMIRSASSGTGATFDDIEAARAMLAARDDCTGNIGIIGNSIGGGFALRSARDRGFSVCSVNYGTVPKDVESILDGACPIIGSFGAKDVQLKGAPARLENALQANGIDHDVKEYPNGGHGFLANHGGALGWVSTHIGMRYDDAVATDVQRRILDFFRQHLTAPAERANHGAYR